MEKVFLMLVVKEADHSCCQPLCPKLAKEATHWIFKFTISWSAIVLACLTASSMLKKITTGTNHCVLNWQKPSIALQEALYHPGLPDFLMVSIHEFLKVCLDISDNTAKLVWAAFCDLAWAFEGTDEDMDALHHKYIKLFMEHGLSHGISCKPVYGW